ncbi:MAG: stage II sporulation protein R [Oscillospiraceae bacterium]|jgi:stage II sporulation protein R|nr:stage II sporulation protein R [Oscillospiraceae bacterium]
MKPTKLFSNQNILAVAMLIGVSLALFLPSAASFADECAAAPDKLFRLHIIANSDSDADQQLKYSLRDFLLADLEEIFAGCDTAEQSRAAAEANRALIEAKARRFVRDSGYDYDVRVSTTKTYFTTRVYGDLTVPAGDYHALRVIIGEGGGRNWWCVLFPPLCLPAASDRSAGHSVLNSADNNEQIEVKFAVYEFFIKKLK